MRYYSAKDGALVTRYGTGTYIGASVGFDKEKGETVITSDPKKVVAISDQEFSKYMREYLKLEREGSLIVSTEKEFAAQQKAEAAASDKEAKELEAEAKKVAAAEALAESKAEAGSDVLKTRL